VETYKSARLAEVAIRGGDKVRPKDQSSLKNTSPGTINRELAVLSHVLHKALEWGWISTAPTRIKLLKDEARRIEYLTVEQCDRLLEAAKAEESSHVYPFVKIGLETSMRRMEILRIRRENVDLVGRAIFHSECEGRSAVAAHHQRAGGISCEPSCHTARGDTVAVPIRRLRKRSSDGHPQGVSSGCHRRRP
jgi:integrase